MRKYYLFLLSLLHCLYLQHWNATFIICGAVLQHSTIESVGINGGFISRPLAHSSAFMAPDFQLGLFEEGCTAVQRKYLNKPTGLRIIARTILTLSQSEISSDHSIKNIITLSDKAIIRLKDIKSNKSPSKDMILRIGVKSGGCSGLSYLLEVVDQPSISTTNYVDKYPQYGFEFHIEPKSMLYILGLELDFSDELIGGGFKFKNPNASRNCSCGMSFGVPKDFLSQEISQNRRKCSN